VMTLVVMFGRDFDTRHPRGEELFYAIDVDQQQGIWVSSDARPGSWLGKFMGDDASEANFSRFMPGYDKDVMIRDSILPQFEAATLQITSDRMIDGRREVSLHLQSPAAAENISLLFADDAGISAAKVNGFPVRVVDIQAETGTGTLEATGTKGNDKDRTWWRWRWFGLPPEGADIVLNLEAGRSLAVKIIEVDYDMPEGAPERPEDSMQKQYTWSDSRVIFQTLMLD